MAELTEIKEEIERVILISVATEGAARAEEGFRDCAEESLDELAELAKTAGAEVLTKVIQNRDRAHTGTYIGKGKIEEVAELVTELSATGVICDDELSPAQLRNLERELGTKVMDRTMLILDIFAQHAQTREGKIQVELAQLKYRATRLIGMRAELSRLGGGIGTRGPGEKKLETDRRLIRDRISFLNQALAQVKSNREVTRAQRQKSAIPVAAIAGYTNAGKSTLLNYLTGAAVLEADQLFATLDPTTRVLTFADGQQLLLTDTVGFIRKLPHHLVDAFRSTLEEAKYADLILHVVDASNENADQQMHVVYDTLRRLGVTDKPIVTVFNKQDLCELPNGMQPLKDLQAERTIPISAKTGAGVPQLLEALQEVLRGRKRLMERTFPYAEAGRTQEVRKRGELVMEEYREDGIYIKAYVPPELVYYFEPVKVEE